jgi:large repetitive protein
MGVFFGPGGIAYADCVSPANAIEAENCLTGNPPSEWDVSGAGDANIQGFATDISVNRGQTVSFKVSTTATAYRIDIYRLGYYQGNGARLVTTIPNAATAKTTQPACVDQQSTTGLVDCGNWSVSASWAVPATAVSGIYIARLQGEAVVTGASHMVFVVRQDGGTSNLLFQTSDTTWHAYNRYGGTSLYGGSGPGTGLSGVGRAYKVSYNRPFNTRETAPEDWLFDAEYPMVRWLERNGYDVSYTTGVDSDRRGAEIAGHKVFLSVGHDEYWSKQQRLNVEKARDQQFPSQAAPVHLAFFSGNEIFWKTRWESSIAGSATPYRTLVCYKETHTSPPQKIDPSPEWTGTWRDPRFSPPSDGGRPENALSGTIFTVNGVRNDNFEVPAADGKMRFWRDTPNVSFLLAGQVFSAPTGTLGYEWDEDLDNGFRPAGLVRLSSTTINAATGVVQDYGSIYAPGLATHHLVFHKRANGALVFGAGTIQWAWGLDSDHDRGSAAPSVDMQQATVNLFADMGVQPASLQAELLPASASADVVAPVSDITSPANGATLLLGSPLTIQGTATDGLPGLVGGVEVSVDGGLTWHPAVGRASWSYVWTPLTGGSHTILSRAVDDTGNLEAPGAGRTVTVNEPPPPSGPVSIWAGSGSPLATNLNDGQPIEFGVKIRSSLAGWITHVRFYKGALDNGTHVGHLWNSTGTLLATGTFAGETVSGWQEVALSSPVAITPNTTYVASCHSSAGYYATTEGYFAQMTMNWPLTALADGTDGPNGLFKLGAPGFPTQSFLKTNYWVDVVYSAQAPGPDTNPPTVVVTAPSNGASGVLAGANVTARFSEALAPATVNGSTVALRNAAAQLVPATVTWDPTTSSAVLDPTAALAYSASYTATVKGGASGVTDVAGNPLGADVAWTFTTQASPPPPPTEGPGGPILVVAYPANPFSRYYAEILRAEGLNAFTVLDVSAVDATVLSGYDVVILGEMPLTAPQVTMLGTWVNAGGNLIAMRPDKQLASLLGLTDAASTLSEGYLLVSTGAAPGLGIVNQTMQFHGTADGYTLAAVTPAATTVATLYSSATTATPNPAVTLRTVGSGEAAAFAFDLARSIVYTRQGNPAWAGDERDGVSPVRSDDMFYGAKVGDVQPDWVDLGKVAIPQADEQQRLLANLILKMNADRKPLPRFWYFPRGEKAVVVMASDNHGSQSVETRFLADEGASPAGCSVADWECIRSTVYLYTGALPNDATAKQWENAGFEVGLHVNTGCADWTPSSLADDFTTQKADFFSFYPSLAPLATHRTHCIAWSDWATQPKVELQNAVRLDTNYYYWPPAWVNNTPGLFTGSGMPMRFADLNGTMIDVYQATTQMTDESGQTYPFTINILLDRAIGTEGYYGAFTANIHTDGATEDQAAAIVSSATARGVPSSPRSRCSPGSTGATARRSRASPGAAAC